MAEYTIENYRIDPGTGEFTRVASYVTFQNLEFFKRLNGYGQAAFSFDIHDPALDPNDFKMYRNNFLIKRDNGIAWLGPLTGYDSEMEADNGRVDIEATEYFYHLHARQTEQNYQKTNTTGGEVAWDLINTVQSRDNGDLGIVQGGIEGIAPINETLEYANIDEALMNLSDNIGGFDFWFDPTLDANGMLDTVRFNLAKSRYRVITDKKITFDQIMAISTSTNRTMYNTTTGLAYGTGDTVLTTLVEDTGAQSGYTRRERVTKLVDYKIQDNLDAAIEEINNTTKVQTNFVNLTLDPGGKFNYSNLELGDVVTIDFRSEDDCPPILQVYGTARVYEINVKVDSNGVEYITPKIKFI